MIPKCEVMMCLQLKRGCGATGWADDLDCDDEGSIPPSDQFANNDSGMEKGRASSPRDLAVILNCNHARDDTPATQALKILPTDYQMVLYRGTKRSMIRQNRGSARSLLTNMSTHTGEPSHTRQRSLAPPSFALPQYKSRRHRAGN